MEDNNLERAIAMVRVVKDQLEDPTQRHHLDVAITLILHETIMRDEHKAKGLEVVQSFQDDIDKIDPPTVKKEEMVNMLKSYQQRFLAVGDKDLARIMNVLYERIVALHGEMRAIRTNITVSRFTDIVYRRYRFDLMIDTAIFFPIQ